MVLVPRASSVMAISASLMGLVVLVFSVNELVALVSSSLLGGVLRMNVGEKLVTAFPSVIPSTSLVAANWAFVSSAGTVAFKVVPEMVTQSGPSSFTTCRLSPSRSVA